MCRCTGRCVEGEAYVSHSTAHYFCVLYSGVKHQDKRDGGGAHNWGTVSDQIQYVGFAILIFITHRDF